MPNKTFGIEVEFYIPSNDKRTLYLRRKSDLLSTTLGIDGANELTSEFRGGVFTDWRMCIKNFELIKKRLDIFDPIFVPYVEHDCKNCDKVHKIPMSIHFSIGNWSAIDVIKALKVYIKLMLRFYKDIPELYWKRVSLYPDFCRVHKDRIEFRFFPNDINVAKVLIKEIVQ